MIPSEWRHGEIAVVGLGRTGCAVAKFLSSRGYRVYASDGADSEALRRVGHALSDCGVATEVGAHDLDRIARSAVVVTSPGIPPRAAPLQAAAEAEVTILPEIDVAVMFLGGLPLVVVSGTNGKSTTTALIAHLLNESGVHAIAAGNIGYPLIEVVASSQKPDWLVIEASSYQLHFSSHLVPDVGVLTNVSPDHLDWHGTVEAYYADKRRVFANATAASEWILNGDDSTVLGLAEGAAGSRSIWSLEGEADAWYEKSAGILVLQGQDLIARDSLPLLGDHNVSNALAAALAATSVGAHAASIARGLQSFEPLRHRLEPIREVDGVLWINDSKATNVASTAVAVRAMTRPFALLMGGRGKGEAYSRLATLLASNCKSIVAFGEDKERIARELGDAVPVQLQPSLSHAISVAGSFCRSGDVVLLSPACASFDQFTNFEERGDVFRKAVESL